MVLCQHEGLQTKMPHPPDHPPPDHAAADIPSPPWKKQRMEQQQKQEKLGQQKLEQKKLEEQNKKKRANDRFFSSLQQQQQQQQQQNEQEPDLQSLCDGLASALATSEKQLKESEAERMKLKDQLAKMQAEQVADDVLRANMQSNVSTMGFRAQLQSIEVASCMMVLETMA